MLKDIQSALINAGMLIIDITPQNPSIQHFSCSNNIVFGMYVFILTILLIVVVCYACVGYRVSCFHREPNSVKTDAPVEALWDIMRCWCAKYVFVTSEYVVF